MSGKLEFWKTVMLFWVNARLMLTRYIWEAFRSYDFMDNFREMTEISAIFVVQKFQTFRVLLCYIKFKGPDLVILNILFVSRNYQILQFYGQ